MALGRHKVPFREPPNGSVPDLFGGSPEGVLESLVIDLRPKLLSALLVVISVCAALLIAEVVLRFRFSDYFVLRPNVEWLSIPYPGVMPGVFGASRFIVNASGMRGDPFPEDDRYRILAVGGSTTECLSLDQSEAWPRLLQDRLNDPGKREVWVGNVGVSGRNTRHHLLQIERLLEQYPGIDLVVLLIGVNDMARRLQRDRDFRPLRQEGPEYMRSLLEQSFADYPVSDPLLPYEFTERTEIGRLYKRVYEWSFFRRKDRETGGVLRDFGKSWERYRRHRRSASEILDTLPDLSSALEEYARNVHDMIDVAHERGSAIVFMTQPGMWREDLPESLSELLWFGGIGNFQGQNGQPYYSVGALADAMGMYNETLLNVCEARAVDCLDLAPLIPKDLSSFYDDVHFNEQGARRVADALARFLVEREIPFVISGEAEKP